MQVAKVCEELASMPELKGGFNAIGFSQGACAYGAACALTIR
jgi:Palmitoyl protein thioesterase